MNKIKPFVEKYRKGVIIGFLFGAVVAPALATLGLVSTFFEATRPVLIGPFDLLGSIIPNVQVSEDTYYVPFYKWVITLLFNGIVYSIIGGFIHKIILQTRSK
jgi:uncharacterized membrane protein